jgi:hypothetical protein
MTRPILFAALLALLLAVCIAASLFSITWPQGCWVRGIDYGSGEAFGVFC